MMIMMIMMMSYHSKQPLIASSSRPRRVWHCAARRYNLCTECCG